jgi:type II secretory pathway pseudopilin PulG
MIELMVVVIIVGVLAAIAVPIYGKYVKNARVSEAQGRIADLLTASKAYAQENDDPSSPQAEWPADSNVPGFLGDDTSTDNFDYVVQGQGGTLTITANGKNKMGAQGGNAAVKVILTVENPNSNGTWEIQNL